MLECPRCAVPLKARRFGPNAVWGCADCDGCAAAFPLLREAVASDRWKILRRAVAAAATPSSRPCPSCKNPMLVADAGGVTVETCRRCQMLWFDRGEAPEPKAPVLSQEAAEAAARFEVESIKRRADLWGDAEADPDGWRLVAAQLGLPYEIEPRGTAIVPWATIGLAIAVITAGLLTLSDPSWAWDWGFLPSAPLRHGGLTPITSFFLHGGILHLFGNAYFLVVFGDDVEEAAGHARFLAMTFAGAVGGALLHGLLDRRANVPLIGASAGISAILVYYALRFPRARIGWFRSSLPARAYVAIWILFQLLGAAEQAVGLTNVSAFGHLGGVIVGVAFWALERRMGAWSSTDGPPS